MDFGWITGIVVGALVVIAIVSRVQRAMRLREPRSSRPTAGRTDALAGRADAPTPPTLPPDAVTEIDRLVAADQKVRAIKVYRDHTDVSLREAKNAVERWVVRSAPATTAIPVAAPWPTGAAALRSSLPTSAAAEIDRLVAAARPIEAIKLLREHTGLGLKQSKDAIDAWTPRSL
ncbi:hypothetical protein [Microbacterium sp. 1.5R]|uniref:hypothetical protein n=1 Tax=Microbacterium sp. 1.5R TaxID=1916917 RepID=UPI00164303C8|nr:hypothetical protein [Microbacterium sp. 1.5R]